MHINVVHLHISNGAVATQCVWSIVAHVRPLYFIALLNCLRATDILFIRVFRTTYSTPHHGIAIAV